MPLPAPALLATALLAPWDLVGIGTAAAVFVAAVVVIAVLARRGAGRRAPAPPAVPPPPPTARDDRGAPTASGVPEPTRFPTGEPVGRRVVVQRGMVGLFVAALAGVATSAVDYVVTAVADRRGKRYAVGSPEAIRRQLATTGTPYYDPVGGFYVVPYPAADLGHAETAYAGAVLDGMEAGFVGLDQTCTHLGCRVKWCRQSQWFECPCHGSRYNAVGEQRRGPAPRGLDRYELTTVDGQVVVDTRHRYLGPPPGTDTTGQAPAGPHCY